MPTRTWKTNNGEPVIVINDLDSSHEISSLVDELLSKNDFSNTSSIFVIVPTSDDNDSDSESECRSTICLQLSDYYQEEPGPAAAKRSRKISLDSLKVSSRGKMFYLEGIYGPVGYSHNKETMVDSTLPILSQFKNFERTENKICQMSTSKEILKDFCNGISTDTTTDRQCCCTPKHTKEELIHDDIVENLSPGNKCIANVVSEFTTPLFVNQEAGCKSCAKHKYKAGMTMQCIIGKKESVKIRPLCPCEQHQPPVFEEPGTKAVTRFCSSQCCICDESQPGKPCGRRIFGRKSLKSSADKNTAKEIIGPEGGMSNIEAGGACTQAGMKPSRRDCECKNKKGKKKNKVKCECPICEPQSEIQAVLQAFCRSECTLEEVEKYLTNHFRFTKEDSLMVLKMAKKLKSYMSQTLSRFKLLIKKKKPKSDTDDELTIDEAMKYYTMMDPDLLDSICGLTKQESGEKKKNDCCCHAGKSTSVDCECFYPDDESVGPMTPTEYTSDSPGLNMEEDESFKGLKLTIEGKGSGSKGLSGVWCFDVIELKIPNSSRHSN